MNMTVTPSGEACGARVEGLDLSQHLTDAQISELRSVWLTHKVIALPNQHLRPEDLERVAQYFGEIGEDPFFFPLQFHHSPQVGNHLLLFLFLQGQKYFLC